jgi:predicted alpha/beta superfamily hydrolase
MATRRTKKPTGALHIEHHHIAHHGDRRVRVYVPAAYDGSKAFPLLVLFDGQNVFDDHGSFAGGWHADRAVERLGKKRTRPIVVGIDHGNAGRIDELAPWGRQGGQGRADTFVGWVSDHLIPDLRRRYHVVHGPAGVLVGGSSLGGLAATYAHFRWPGTFGGALAMSPSFWLGSPRIFDFVAAQPVPWTSQIYLDAGAHEGGGGMARLAERMAAVLRERGYASDRLMHKHDPKGTHSERAWRRRLPGALRFFYR